MEIHKDDHWYKLAVIIENNNVECFQRLSTWYIVWGMHGYKASLGVKKYDTVGREEKTVIT